MKAKIFTLFLFLAVGSMAFAQELEVKYTPNLAPTIDGVIDSSDPWQADDWVSQDALGATSTTDATSKFQLLWDDDNLYLGVQVVDATPNNDHATDYQNDCVEAFIHMTGGSVEGTEVAYDASTCQLRFPRGETTFSMTGTGSFVTALQADAGFEYAVVSDADGWVLEVTLPVAILDPAAAFDGENMMFEIQTADNTGEGRTGQMFWLNNSDNQWRYVDTFAGVHLSTEEVVIGAVQSLNSANASAWVANDMLNFKNVEGQINIYSISGALVKTEVIERNGSIDIAAMKAGLYIVSGDNFTAKIVK
jgi:hypothetical protein